MDHGSHGGMEHGGMDHGGMDHSMPMKCSVSWAREKVHVRFNLLMSERNVNVPLTVDRR